ncbi:class I SAM-dependent methyltransferase [Sphingomonas sp. SUN019]|uniref:class I SAM-dependent methyltransferase n=1 Tax=Sphingomonas sp. SUN019 TaxID=2937788 RepID=UPI002164B729|nr:class I SAM-dependent methyltransferase [Sphingomonas sp. SUN019]UVO52376.1 class I SAM-dependent methyltransferase [Sphingomonas sp. SUN019]
MSIFEEIVTRCDGMLSPAAYQALYEAGRRGGLIVEVGTALGAATVALALGLKDSGRPGRVISFDPMLGGPRRQISTSSARVDHITESLRHFAVDEFVTLVTSTLPDGLGRIPADEKISVLVIDADGRIDRDLIAVYDMVEAGGMIIVDDVLDKVRLRKSGNSKYRIDAKMRLSYLLVKILEDDRFISPMFAVGNTYFGEKPYLFNAPIDPIRMLEGYRQIVFCDARMSKGQMMRYRILRLAERHMPRQLQHARMMYRRRVEATQ